MNRNTFISAVRRNADRVTHYQSGADGALGGCDCIGLIIGAIRLLGEAWNGTHGSNYTARYEMRELKSISCAADLKPGDLCFKARKKGDKGYALPSRYQSYTDTQDYYHVGVVMSASPLEIWHCSDGGMHRDTALGAWRFAGALSRVEEEVFLSCMAVVTSANGGSVNLREKADTRSKRLLSVPCGAQVQLLSLVNDEWARVCVSGQEGYMMRTFLQNADNITITLPRDAARTLFEALKSSLGA